MLILFWTPIQVWEYLKKKRNSDVSFLAAESIEGVDHISEEVRCPNVLGDGSEKVLHDSVPQIQGYGMPVSQQYPGENMQAHSQKGIDRVFIFRRTDGTCGKKIVTLPCEQRVMKGNGHLASQ